MLKLITLPFQEGNESKENSQILCVDAYMVMLFPLPTGYFKCEEEVDNFNVHEHADEGERCYTVLFRIDAQAFIKFSPTEGGAFIRGGHLKEGGIY